MLSPEKPKRGERGEQVLAYARGIIYRREVGEIVQIPTYRELAEKFNYKDSGSVYNFLHRQGVRFDSRPHHSYIKPLEALYLEPSVDLAWFLGVTSAGGVVNRKIGSIGLRDEHEDLLDKFRLIGERLFLLNPSKLISREKNSWSKIHLTQPGYEFYSVRAARFLGNLKSDIWPSTILAVHPWVLDDSRYAWEFINGFFEKRGGVYHSEKLNKRKDLISLFTHSLSGANLLSEMLVKQGLENPRITFGSGRLRCVDIVKLSDIKIFAKYVHSIVDRKEEDLDHYRLRSLYAYERYSKEDLLDEWKRITNTLGYYPTIRQIEKIKGNGKITVSYVTYAERFGQGSFVKAREVLERLVSEPGSSPRNKKSYHPASVEDVVKMEKVFNSPKEEVPLNILVDLQGRPLRANLSYKNTQHPEVESDL